MQAPNLSIHENTLSQVTTPEETEIVPCRDCHKQKDSDLMAECSGCNRLYCSECIHDIKEKRARTWWWMGGYNMYFLSKMSDFRCRRCLRDSDTKGNYIVIIIGVIIIIGALVTAEMNGLDMLNI
jgi:hypothetical protein